MRLRAEARRRAELPPPVASRAARASLAGHELRPATATAIAQRFITTTPRRTQHHGRPDEARRPCPLSGAGPSRPGQLWRLSVSYSLPFRPQYLANRLRSFIVVGILVSYLPQHLKIISRRSSRGLSPLFVLLGTVSGTASIANILTLPESTTDMACCKEIGSFPCAAALLGIAQIGVQWTCFFFMYACLPLPCLQHR